MPLGSWSLIQEVKKVASKSMSKGLSIAQKTFGRPDLTKPPKVAVYLRRSKGEGGKIDPLPKEEIYHSRDRDP